MASRGRTRPAASSPTACTAGRRVVDRLGVSLDRRRLAGLDPRRAVIYELHVGTFTPAGTFRGAIEQPAVPARPRRHRDRADAGRRVRRAAQLGLRRRRAVRAVARLRAARRPARAGRRRARHGLAVLLDVVYNHLGPEGDYLPAFSPRLSHRSARDAVGRGGQPRRRGQRQVRRLLVENALLLDPRVPRRRPAARRDARALRRRARATSSPRSPRRCTRAADPPPLVFAEDHRNLATHDRAAVAGAAGGSTASGPTTSTTSCAACWRRRDGYSSTTRARAASSPHAAAGLALHRASGRGMPARPRGTDPSPAEMRRAVDLPPEPRPGRQPRVRRSAWSTRSIPRPGAPPSALLLTAPMTPLLFMGQEWAASTPFLFFTDFAGESAGRSSRAGAGSSRRSPRSPTPARPSAFPIRRPSHVRGQPAAMGRAGASAARAGARAASRSARACGASGPRSRRATRASARPRPSTTTRSPSAAMRPAAVGARRRAAARQRDGRRCRRSPTARWSPLLTTEDAGYAARSAAAADRRRPARIDSSAPGAIVFAGSRT